MKPIIIVGTVIVHLALISYGIGIISEQLKHRVTRPILIFLGCGLAFDLTATVCMIMGSGRGFISQHGFLGIPACWQWRLTPPWFCATD